MPRIGKPVIRTNKCEIIGGIRDSLEFIDFVLMGGIQKKVLSLNLEVLRPWELD